MNKETVKSVSSQEVHSLVCTPRTEPASGNKLRKNLENFELRSTDSQITRISELASFWYTVKAGMHYKTIPDMDDCFGDFTPACREYTHPRADPFSRAYAAVPGGTVIGPVVGVRVEQFLGNHGLEIESPSPNRPETTSWVVICKGKNRFVDELHAPDPKYNLTSSESLSEQAIAREGELCSTGMKAIRH